MTNSNLFLYCGKGQSPDTKISIIYKLNSHSNSFDLTSLSHFLSQIKNSFMLELPQTYSQFIYI